MAKGERLLIDSCVFVSLFTGGVNDDREMFAYSKRLLELVQEGNIDAYVAAITIPEVFGDGAIRGAHLRNKVRQGALGKARQWFDQNNVTVVELSRAFAFRSAEMAPEYQLKGADASILQALEVTRAAVLCTWDKDLLKCASLTPSFPVVRPSDYIDQQGIPFVKPLFDK